MNVFSYKDELNRFEGDVISIILFEEDLENINLLGSEIKGKIERILEIENFKGKRDQFLKVPLGDKIKSLYIVGAGKKSELNEETMRRIGSVISSNMKKNKYEKGLVIRDGEGKFDQPLTEGLILGVYSFEKYKTKDKEEKKVEEIYIYEGKEDDIRLGKFLAEAQIFTRDLVNEPGNVINPITLSEIAKNLAQEKGLECRIYDEREIKEMGMLALYSVGKGSSTPPRFIHLTYKPDKPKKKIAIVGKGLTFDSGGLNIKPGDYMRTMKMDKAGACAVLGIMKAIADLKPDVEVHALIGAAENMPGGNAYRPDDIIKAKNGKTIEIDNTDAEGRVTMADVLSYASELEPDEIIDMATLTGACMVALGEYTAGLFSNSDELAKAIETSSKRTGERVWRLPLDDERLRKKIKSSVADVVNSGGRYGGAITAAMFLEEFVKEGIKWAHLDIAGPAYSKENFYYYQKGATGFGVRLCLDYILNST